MKARHLKTALLSLVATALFVGCSTTSTQPASPVARQGTPAPPVSQPRESPGYPTKTAPHSGLILAAVNNRNQQVQDFLAKGVDINTTDEWGKTALHYVAMNEDGEAMAASLLSKGANVNARDLLGRTPLHDAALRLRKRTIELLLAKGAEVNARDKEGHTPLGLAQAVRRIGDSLDIETQALIRKYGGTD